MRIVCLSDVHSLHDGLRVPDGDLLLVAGDLSKRGTVPQLEAFDRWIATMPHRHKVIIAGNHDFALEQDPKARALLGSAIYLEDEGVEIEGFKIWGSPWQPRFFDWAFNLDRGEPLRRVWAKIPEGTDILITHGPPYGILDACWDGRKVGCEELRKRVFEVKPRLHVFGHIHEAYGEEEIEGVRFVNASTCTLEYRATNVAVVVEL